MIAIFRFRFASFHFEAKMMEVFRFRFASFCFKAKMMAIFRFFFVLFSLRSIFVSLQISMFCIDAKQAKKHFFLHRSEKNFASVSLHFASKRKWRRTILVTGSKQVVHWTSETRWEWSENEVRLQALHRAPPQQPTPSVVKLEGGPAASVKPGQKSCVRSRGIITLSAQGPSDSLGRTPPQTRLQWWSITSRSPM